MTGILARMNSSESGGALDDPSHSTVGEPGFADLIVTIDRTEERPTADASG